MNSILPEMGYSSKTCWHVVFGPRKYLGVGTRDLVTEQGVQQTMILLKHIQYDQDLSKLNLNWAWMVPATRRNWQTNSRMPTSQGNTIPGHPMVQNTSELPMLHQCWTLYADDRCPQSSQRTRSSTDGIVPCDPTLHLQRPIPSELMPALPPG